MRKWLRGKALNDPVLQTPDASRKALLKQGLCSADGALTPRGRVCAISLLPLDQQCQVLGLSLTEHRVAVAGVGPERGLMETYEASGVPCCFTEGGIVKVVLYSLCFERLVRLGTAKWGRIKGMQLILDKSLTPVQSMMYGGFMIYQEFLGTVAGLENDLLADIEQTSIDQALENFDVLRSWQVTDTWFPYGYVGLTRRFVELVLEHMPRATVVPVARLFFSDPYAFARGWPDLTVVEAGEVNFIEVKTTDRLHVNQIITAGEMAAVAGVRVNVVRIVRE